MKAAAFSYSAPETLDDCVALLAQHSGDAKILAGGQSLMPLMNLRMVRPGVIVDIRRVSELNRWQIKDNSVCVGALVRQRSLEMDAELAARLPLMAEAILLVGHPATRNRGTIVGSMCHADPAAELPVCAVLLGAEFRLRSANGPRAVKAEDFFEAALSTAVREDEIVEEVRIPLAPPGAAYAFEEFARRHGDFAIVSCAAAVERNADGLDARVALGGVAMTPASFRYADFAGKVPLQQSRIAEFARHVSTLIEPGDDLHATADFRRSLAATLIERSLLRAWQRAALKG